MGKTVYSRNPSTSKGTSLTIQLLELQERTSESIIKTLTKLPTLSRVLPFPRLNSTLRTSLPTEDVFHILSISVELVELDKLQNSEKLSVDGQKNQSELFSD